MKFIPLHDRILVKRLEQEDTTKGGIIIPDTAKEKPMKGSIIAVGPGKTNESGKITPISLKAGDTVLFNKYAGNEIKLDDETYSVMREDDILAVIE